jgi:hypothetical protein
MSTLSIKTICADSCGIMDFHGEFVKTALFFFYHTPHANQFLSRATVGIYFKSVFSLGFKWALNKMRVHIAFYYVLNQFLFDEVMLLIVDTKSDWVRPLGTRWLLLELIAYQLLK